MSDDQSFYEIQLNTPHLVLAFLAAAVVGVTVFWLGVVIGRGQTESGLADQWQAAAPAQGTEEEAYEFYEAVSEPAIQPQAPAETAAAETDSPAQPEAEQPSSAVAPRFEPADPVDEQRATVVAESSAGLPRHDASLPSGWVVQVRSTPDKPDADALQSSLVAAGFPAFVVSVEVSGVTHYRVRVGRYRSKGEADIIEVELLTRSEVDATWVTEG